VNNSVDYPVLDVICPMHVIVSKTGHIVNAGPTAEKLSGRKDLVGLRFLEIFQLSKPRQVKQIEDLSAILAKKLHLQLREPPHTSLKGVAMRSGEDGNFLINLSFGISIQEAIGAFSLTNTDFAATDMTVEMLYLLEAKSATLQALRTLNNRLHGDKIAAEEKAYTDALTGLKNRRALDNELSKLVARHHPLALMHVDLDYFKAVNDTHGHAAGDLVLEHVAKVFNKVTGEGDIVSRVGGDEFILVLPKLTEKSRLKTLGRKIISALEEPVIYQDIECKISGSIGTVIWDGFSPTSPETLINDADIALYASKDGGRGRQTFYRPVLRERTMANDDDGEDFVELWGIEAA
jgi:diguanylate cyclase (GGDEF)-like protein